MAELVGPSGRVVAVESDGLVDALAEHVDLVLIGTQASEHVALRDAQRMLESRRPILLVRFSPQALRESGTDPVSVLDGYRAMGLRARGAAVELPADPGELVQAVDAGDAPVTLRLERVDPPSPERERLLPADRRLGRTWARRFPAVEPGTLAYDATQRALVGSVLDDEEWGALFSGGAPLPAGLGAGFDERVVEYPWLFSRGLSGRVLDAGSVLNHQHLVERLLPAVEDLTIVTLAPEPTAHTSLGVSYLYDDMRDASSLVLAARLEGEGAEAIAYDPIAAERARVLLPMVELAPPALEALEGAEAAVLVTEWPEFAELDWAEAASRMERPLIVDGRNFLDPAALRAAGFEYEGIGRAPGPAPPRHGSTESPCRRSSSSVGEGTRLRPLTEGVPKPALTLVDRPMLAYTIEWLAGHGVAEVVLACGFLPDILREALAGEEERAGVVLRYAAEPEPLGTAGAIRFAAAELGDRLGDRFLALNGDVLSDLDLTLLQRAHERAGAAATIGLHQVEDSATYGLISTDAAGAVTEFAEKTGEQSAG